MPVSSIADIVPITLINKVFSNGVPITINNEADFPDYYSPPSVKSICCLPMRNQGKNMGVLYLENTLVRNAFPIQQQIMLEHLAGQIANSIHRTYLNLNLQVTLDSVQRRNDLLRNLDTMKDEFVRTTSHELRTPLNAILGLTDVLKETNLTENQLHYCDLIYSSAEALLLIINDILDFQACQKNELQLSDTKFDLRTCIDECIRIISTSRSSSVVLNLLVDDFLTNDIFVTCDRTRLQQVISNLLSNSLKFTNEGNITVEIRIKHKDENNITVEFKVKDTGVGIPDEKKEFLFQAFSQMNDSSSSGSSGSSSSSRKYSGAGLGLALAQHIVGALSSCNSKITCNSTFGQGSQFAFTLKLPYFCNTKQKSILPKTRSLLQETILYIISSNEITSKVISAELSSIKFANVQKFPSFSLAIKMATENYKQLPPRKQIIIFDIDVTSITRIKEIITKYYPKLGKLHINVILVCAYDQRSNLLSIFEEYILNKVVFICSRPFPKHSLFRAISQVIEEISAPSSPTTSCIKKKNSSSSSSSIKAPSDTYILMVEDNKMNQKVQLRLLNMLKFNTVVAADGKLGLEAFISNIENDDENIRFDLVLMDCHMPVMDGFESTLQIRAYEKKHNLPHTHIVALTAGLFCFVFNLFCFFILI